MHIFSPNDSLGLPNVEVRVNCKHTETIWEPLIDPMFVGNDDLQYATNVEVCTHCHAWFDPKTCEWVASRPNYEPEWEDACYE